MSVFLLYIMSPFLLYVWVCVYVCMYSCVSIYMLKNWYMGIDFFSDTSIVETRQERDALKSYIYFFYFLFLWKKLILTCFLRFFMINKNKPSFLLMLILSIWLQRFWSSRKKRWQNGARLCENTTMITLLYRKRYMAVSFIMRTLWIFWEKTIILLQKHWNKYIWCDLISKILTLALWLEF